MQTPNINLLKPLSFALVISLFSFFGCRPKGDSPELIALKEKMASDSLELVQLQHALDTINATLDSAQMLKSILQDARSMSRLSAAEKINALDSLLTVTMSQADRVQLSEESNNPLKRMLNEALREKSLLLAEQKAYYAKVQAEIEALSTGVVNMTRIIAQKDQELIAKDDIIQKLAKARKEKEAELNAALLRLRNTEMMIEQANRSVATTQANAQKTRANVFYEAGNTLREEFERLDKKAITLGTKKARESLIKQAVEYYEKAEELEHPLASIMLKKLQSERRYSRFLD